MFPKQSNFGLEPHQKSYLSGSGAPDQSQLQLEDISEIVQQQKTCELNDANQGANKRKQMFTEKPIEISQGFFLQEEDMIESFRMPKSKTSKDELPKLKQAEQGVFTQNNNNLNSSLPAPPIVEITVQPQFDHIQLIQLSKMANQKKKKQSQQFWIKKSFKIIQMVNHFLHQMRGKLVFWRPHKLLKLQLDLINDQASKAFKDGWGITLDIRNNQFTLLNDIVFKCLDKRKWKARIKQYNRKIFAYFGWFKDSIQLLLSLLQKIPTISPYDWRFRLWQYILFLTILLFIVLLPLIASFSQVYIYFQDNQYLMRLTGSVFLTDILVQLNTQAFVKGIHIFDRSIILKHYIKNSFPWDFITMIAAYNMHDNIIWMIIFYFKVFIFSKITDQIRESVLLNETLNGVLSLLILFFKMLFLCHLFACLWYHVGNIEFINYNSGWLVEFNLQSQDQLIQYLNSFYYAVITMATVGYGDYSPKTHLERLIALIMVFICCGMFGYTINSIGSILMEIGKKNVRYKQKLAELKQYLQIHNVDGNLQGKAFRYLEYIYKQDMDKQNNSSLCLNQLSKYLKDEIMQNIYIGALQNIPMLKQHFSKKFLASVSLKMQEIALGPDELILKKDQPQDPALYYIACGEVDSFVEHGTEGRIKQHSIKNFKETQFFGQYEFFTNSQISYINYHSLSITRIYKLKLTDFVECIENFPEDKEMFHFICDNVTLNKRYDLIGLYCNSCKRSSHLLFECPQILYRSDQRVMLQNIFQKEKQFRGMFIRSRVKKTQSSLKSNMNVCKKANIFLEKNFSQIFSSEDLIDDEIILQGDNMNLEMGSQSNNSDKPQYTQQTNPRTSLEENIYNADKIKIQKFNHQTSLSEKMDDQINSDQCLEYQQDDQEIRQKSIRPKNSEKSLKYTNTQKQIIEQKIKENYQLINGYPKNILQYEEEVKNNHQESNQDSFKILKKMASTTRQVSQKKKTTVIQPVLANQAQPLTNQNRYSYTLKYITEMNIPNSSNPKYITISDLTQQCIIEDSVKNYKTYFPHNNIEEIENKQLLQIQKRKISKKKW